MPYATHEYYLNTYLDGETDDSKTIPTPQVYRYLRQASSYLNGITLGRIGSEVTDSIKDCTCEIAEALYLHDKRDGISSENNDGYSVSYTPDDLDGKVYDIAVRHLLPTGLLYRGVR